MQQPGAPQQPTQPSKKSNKNLWIILGIVGGVILLTIFICAIVIAINSNQITQKTTEETTATTPSTTTETTTPTPPPTTSSPPQKPTITINSVTSPVSRGSYATLDALATPGANCEITVNYKSGPSKAQGLYAKTADNDGNVSWTWKVGTNTTPGSWPITVTATTSGGTSSTSTYFEVVY